MTNLENEIYQRLLKQLDLDEAELEGVDENSLLFASDVKKAIEAGEYSGTAFNLDSIDALELVVMLEQHWQLGEIPANDIAEFTSIKQIAAYLQAQGKA